MGFAVIWENAIDLSSEIVFNILVLDVLGKDEIIQLLNLSNTNNNQGFYKLNFRDSLKS